MLLRNPSAASMKEFLTAPGDTVPTIAGGSEGDLPSRIPWPDALVG